MDGEGEVSSNEVGMEHNSSEEAAEDLSSPLVHPPHGGLSRHFAHSARCTPTSLRSRVWLALVLVFACGSVLWWSVSVLFPAGLADPPQYCLQPIHSTLQLSSLSATQQSPMSPQPSLDDAVLESSRAAYGCVGNITAVLSARRLRSCTDVTGKEGEIVETSTSELTQLFDGVTMNGSYRVMNVALESFDGGYLLAARLWDGWLWEDPVLDRVRIAKYVWVEEHRTEIVPPLPLPLPNHTVSSLLAFVRVDYRFEPLSAVEVAANEPEVQDPRLYWLHDSDNSSSSRLFVLGNTGFPRWGSSVLPIKPRRVMTRGQVSAPSTSSPTVSVPWVPMLSEVAWSDQKNWTPLALHYHRHVFLVSFFPLQLVDCPDHDNCVPLQCDRSTASLREKFEVQDWRGGSAIVEVPYHYLSSNNASTSSSSSSFYLTVIHQRARAPFIYHYSHRFVVLSIDHHNEQHVAVRYVSDSFQLPPPTHSEPVKGMLRYVEYITGLVLEHRDESLFNGQLVMTFGRRDSSVHYITLDMQIVLPFLIPADTEQGSSVMTPSAGT